MNIVSDWTRQLELGEQPSQADLLDHLKIIHQNNAGFTEIIANKCKDKFGRSSYDILLDIIDEKKHVNILDIACGSGFLLDLCNKKFRGKLNFTGVDISIAELELASKKLSNTKTKLIQSMAQNLDFLTDNSFEVILCHWALPLMDPIAPVFAEVKRVLTTKGCFAAIIDGDLKSVPEYQNIHNIIYKYVHLEYPNYASIELGDIRVRNTVDLYDLAIKTFINSDISITSHVLYLKDSPKKLAQQVSGFFYASFVLSIEGHKEMLVELENYFKASLDKNVSCYTMPVNMLRVQCNKN